MPCHSDRVRRSYHSIHLSKQMDNRSCEQVIQIRISRLALATPMSKEEVWHNIARSIRNGVFQFYVGGTK